GSASTPPALAASIAGGIEVASTGFGAATPPAGVEAVPAAIEYAEAGRSVAGREGLDPLAPAPPGPASSAGPDRDAPACRTRRTASVTALPGTPAAGMPAHAVTDGHIGCAPAAAGSPSGPTAAGSRGGDEAPTGKFLPAAGNTSPAAGTAKVASSAANESSP